MLKHFGIVLGGMMLASTAAMAGEDSKPITLSDESLDQVTAGWFDGSFAGATADSIAAGGLLNAAQTATATAAGPDGAVASSLSAAGVNLGAIFWAATLN